MRRSGFLPLTALFLALLASGLSHASAAPPGQTPKPEQTSDQIPGQTPEQTSGQTSGQTVQSDVVDLAPSPGETQRVLATGPVHPRATLILLPGGTGDIGLERNGTLRHSRNFLLRMRTDWVAQGFAVLVPDALNHTNLRGKRSSTAYGQLVDSLARFAHTRFQAPVFLVGTSQGTIAATNGAARAPAGLIAGLVLTESVSLPGHLSVETVFDAQPHTVRVPVLIIANQQDACPVASPLMAPRIAQAMTQAPEVRLLSVSGGSEHSAKPCSSLSAHGYYGMEHSVSRIIVSWLRAHTG